MAIAPSTARTHVQRVLMKLGVGSRLEAAALAARTGLLDRVMHRPQGAALIPPQASPPGTAGEDRLSPCRLTSRLARTHSEKGM